MNEQKQEFVGPTDLSFRSFLEFCEISPITLQEFQMFRPCPFS